MGREPHALADREESDPGRAAPLVGARRQQRPAGRHRSPPEGLRGVHQQRHPRGPAELRHLGHRLPGAHLVVGRLQAGQRGVLAQRVRVGLRAHRARTVHRHLGEGSAAALVGGGRMEHRRVFDRRHHQMAADTPTPRERSGNSGMDRPRARRGESQLVGTAADGLRGRLPGRVQQQPGAPSLPVETGRVGPALVQRGKQRLAGDGMEGGCGRGVEVGHPATLARPRPRPVTRPPGRPGERASDGGRSPGFHPFGESGGALGTLPARPQIASSRVWSA